MSLCLLPCLPLPLYLSLSLTRCISVCPSLLVSLPLSGFSPLRSAGCQCQARGVVHRGADRAPWTQDGSRRRHHRRGEGRSHGEDRRPAGGRGCCQHVPRPARKHHVQGKATSPSHPYQLLNVTGLNSRSNPYLLLNNMLLNVCICVHKPMLNGTNDVKHRILNGTKS